MGYKNNIHLSKNELFIIQDMIGLYIENKINDNSNSVLNYSVINLIKNIYLKIANKHDELSRYNYINHDKVINSWKNELMEKSRDKILEFNNNHNVKTDFYDITDFNRWEKIRTYEKSK